VEGAELRRCLAVEHEHDAGDDVDDGTSDERHDRRQAQAVQQGKPYGYQPRGSRSARHGGVARQHAEIAARRATMWDTALARVKEIGLGIICTTVISKSGVPAHTGADVERAYSFLGRKRQHLDRGDTQRRRWQGQRRWAHPARGGCGRTPDALSKFAFDLTDCRSGVVGVRWAEFVVSSI
jgi:hypothetical protein